MPTATTNIINAIRHPEKTLWRGHCSCGESGLAYYSTAWKAVEVYRSIHKCKE